MHLIHKWTQWSAPYNGISTHKDEVHQMRKCIICGLFDCKVVRKDSNIRSIIFYETFTDLENK